MRAFTGSTVVEQPSVANRRQPVRQARTNPSRTTTNLAITTTSSGQTPDGANDETRGFFPAITHFTDSITALPKEMIRHYTMLKEVDAKVHGPEEKLGQLLNAGLRASALKPTEAGTEIGMSTHTAHVQCDFTSSHSLMTYIQNPCQNLTTQISINPALPAESISSR